MKSLFLLTSTFLGLAIASAPQQFCFSKAGTATDICLALASSPNATTGVTDLALHISVKTPDAKTGWAAFGIGDRMNGALMFVMYPGENDGDVTLSLRSTKYHNAPSFLTLDSTPAPPSIHVTRTWISDSHLLNAQVLCYNCSSWAGKSWTGKSFDIMSAKQPWIWATNNNQLTGSGHEDMKIVRHTDFGHMFIDMESAYMSSFTMPEVASSRVAGISALSGGETEGEKETSPASPSQPFSPPVSAPAEAHPKHHTHSPLGIVSIHGFVLSTGFFLLSIGVLAIRSGLANPFKVHWVVQTVGGSAIVFGYCLGILISFKHGSKFRTPHQIIGLIIVPAVAAQGFLGYIHHKNFLRYKSRTAVSYWHIWIGRAVLALGNFNILLGLVLSHASQTKFYICIISLSLQITILGPMWYFWSKGHTIKDVVSKKDLAPDYEEVEQEAFILEGDSDDEEEGKREEVELKRLTEDEP